MQDDGKPGRERGTADVKTVSMRVSAADDDKPSPHAMSNTAATTLRENDDTNTSVYLNAAVNQNAPGATQDQAEVFYVGDCASPYKQVTYLREVFLSIFAFGLGLVLLAVLFSSVYLLYGQIAYKTHGGASSCQRAEDYCVTPLGAIVGVHDGVFGYSNCNTSYISRDSHTMQIARATSGKKHHRDADTRQLSTGMRWQCVEYARRYWMLRGKPEPATFGDVDGAADIWDILTEAQLLDGIRTPLLKYANGARAAGGGAVPQVGDLLIYPIQKGDFEFGHVAVVVGVDVSGAKVYVAEQNWDNEMWPGPYHNYSRVLSLKYDKSDRAYKIKDHHITIAGWVRPAPRSAASVSESNT